MRITFPSFDTLAVGTGGRGDLQVVGLRSAPEPHGLYLAAWQAGSTGNWMIPSYNVLAFGQGVTRAYSEVALGIGNSQQLQLLGLGADDQRLHLVGWQDPQGTWHPYTGGPLGLDRRFQSMVWGVGNSQQLQVLGLGTDGIPALATWQSPDGKWHTPASNVIPGTRTYQALAAGNGNSGMLQIIGLAQTHQIYLVSWQDSHGTWHPPSAKDSGPLGGDRQYKAVATGTGSNKQLQVIGIGMDDKVYLAAWQSSDGTWNAYRGAALGSDRVYTAVALANGNNGYLQVVGLGKDGKAYLVSWQDSHGTWHPPSAKDSGPLGGDRQYKVVATGIGNNKQLQVIGIGTDGKLYLAAWQRSDGTWNAGWSLAQEDDGGRWNSVRLTDVPRAFNAVPAQYTQRDRLLIADPPLLEYTFFHFQGMAAYKNYYLFTRDAPDYGKIFVVDRQHSASFIFETPEKGYSHPGGCQIVGDYLGVELEKGQDSSIRFYWLGSLTNEKPPTLLPSRVSVSKASALAITDVGPQDERRYIMALKIGDDVRFYTSNGCLLDDPDLDFTLNFTATKPSILHGADNLCLLTDVNDKVYLIMFSGEESGLFVDDYADLYEVDLVGQKIQLIQSRHMTTSSPGKILWGVHFRWAAGGQVINTSALELYTSERNPEFNEAPVLNYSHVNTNTFKART